jgi:hypothetical protein
MNGGALVGIPVLRTSRGKIQLRLKSLMSQRITKHLFLIKNKIIFSVAKATWK